MIRRFGSNAQNYNFGQISLSSADNEPESETLIVPWISETFYCCRANGDDPDSPPHAHGAAEHHAS